MQKVVCAAIDLCKSWFVKVGAKDCLCKSWLVEKLVCVKAGVWYVEKRICVKVGLCKSWLV